MLRVGRDEHAAWKLHIGIHLVVNGTPKAVRIRKIVSPAKLDDTVKPGPWEPALAEANATVDKHGIPGMKKASKHNDMVDDLFWSWGANLTHEAGVWAMAAEKTTGINQVHARGQFPRSGNDVLGTC